MDYFDFNPGILDRSGLFYPLLDRINGSDHKHAQTDALHTTGKEKH